MKIFNLFSHLSRKDINNILNYLPKEYKDIDIPVYIVRKGIIGVFAYIWYYKKTYGYSLKECLRRYTNTGGCSTYVTYCETGKIEPLSIIITSSSKERAIFYLLHEIRHSYQQKYLQPYHEKHSEKYFKIFDNMSDEDTKSYQYQVLERDANNFAKKIAKKMGIKFKNNSYKII